MTLTIHVDGQLAITTAQAAELHGRSSATMRKLFARAIDAGQLVAADHIDGRTPVYLATDIDRIIAEMPGRGAHLRRA